MTRSERRSGSNCPAGSQAQTVRILTAGYDNFYQSAGTNPGDPDFGVTAARTMAQTGTIAAPSTYPFGTKMYVPNYGQGAVLDRGRAIKNAT